VTERRYTGCLLGNWAKPRQEGDKGVAWAVVDGPHLLLDCYAQPKSSSFCKIGILFHVVTIIYKDIKLCFIIYLKIFFKG